MADAGPDLSAIAAAWPLYFESPLEAFTPQDTRAMLAQQCAAMFRGPGASLISTVEWAHDTVVRINYDDLLRHSEIDDLEDALRDESATVVRCLGLGLCAIRATKLPPYTPPAMLVVRIQSVKPIRPIREIKADVIDRFVAVRGNVVRVSAIRPLVTQMDFRCDKCLQPIPTRFLDGKYDPPQRCTATKGCRSKRFQPVRESALTVDWQRIRVQEVETDPGDAGRVPRSVDVEVACDLVDACVPGDTVHVSGVVKAVNADVAAGRSSSQARNLFLLYIDAHSIATTKVSRAGGVDTKQFSEKELRMIRAVATHADPFALVVASLCPGIFGMDAVKAALALGLFGGSQPSDHGDAVVAVEKPASAAGDDSSADAAASHSAAPSSGGSLDRFRVGVRPDPHILVVGDPGLGKSQMLRAVAGLSPRGVYVCGNTASSSGLTVTMIRDPDTGDFGLEAGALVLSDQGICCIDEFDKCKSEHQALLEAMEQQRISIAKAGIVASLSARTSVLAAANPIGGHYDRSKTVMENLKMSQALLSRFDLIFILVDRPDEERDRQLSAHVMQLHTAAARMSEDVPVSQPSHASGERRALSREIARSMAAAEERLATQTLTMSQAALRGRPSDPSSRTSGAAALLVGGSEGGFGAVSGSLSLIDDTDDIDRRLRRRVQAIDDPLPPVLLRKYVAYARRYCHPVLSPAAAVILQDFFLALRQSHQTDESTPITTRQLESMVRLAQARAKIELRETVSRADAVDVVQLMRRSLMDVAMDEIGGLDFTRSTGMSMGRQIKALVDVLNRVARQRGSPKFTRDDISSIVTEMGLQVASLTDLLETMNQQNYILKKGPGLFQLMTSVGGGE